MKTIPEHINQQIIRFLQKEATEQDILELRAWIEEDKEHKQYFDQMNEAFQTSQVLGTFTHEKVNQAWTRVNRKIAAAPKAPARTTVIKLYQYNILRIAATVSAIVLLSYVAWTQFNKTTHHAPQSTIVYRAGQRNTKIFLPDGTAVWLNTNSTLVYAPDFGVTKREVFLKGEAFFDVHKDTKNFIVNAEAFTIQVKGTRFNVRAYTNEENIRTTLEEGSVDLMVNNTGDGERYAMKPGDQITFNAQQRVVTRQTVNPSDYTAWKEDMLIFDDTPLADIILKLENRYKVHVLINDTLAKRERLTMTIGTENLNEVLEFIQVSSRLKIRKENTNIYIYE